MIKLEVDVSILGELTHVKVGDSFEGFEVLHREHIGSGRWTQTYQLVLRKDGTIFGTTYEEGSTEMQEDIEPFGYCDTVELQEYEARKETVIRYVPWGWPE